MNRARLLSLGGACLALALTSLATSFPAGAATAAPVKRVYSISYDGKGAVSYQSQGDNGDAGCYMDMSEGMSYGFGQLWTVRVTFSGTKATKVSILHVDGPNGGGASHLIGVQSSLSGQTCQELTYSPDTGSYDCTSTTMKATAFNNPQMEISHKGTGKAAHLVFTAQAFLDGRLKYTGQDTIPADANVFHGCARYDNDLTYGSDLIPGVEAAAKVSLPVSRLLGLGKRKSVTVAVSAGHNTLLPPQLTCDSTFGTPNVCTISKQTFKATFKLIRVR